MHILFGHNESNIPSLPMPAMSNLGNSPTVIHSISSPPQNGLYDETQRVYSYENHIYFYSSINDNSILDLIREVREIDERLRSEQISRDMEDQPKTPIILHINSEGGMASSAMAFVEVIPTIKSPIYSRVEGVAASAATLISVSCQKEHRSIGRYSFIMIHELHSVLIGRYTAQVEQMKMSDMVMDIIRQIYLDNTKLNRDQLDAFMSRDMWFNATDAVRYGFCDKIT